MGEKLSKVVKGTITLKVFSDGTEVPGTVYINSVNIVKAINRISSASMIISEGGSGDGETFDASIEGYFDPGKEIEIKAGYSSDNESLYKGIVIKHGMKVNASGGFMLSITCKDSAVKLTIGRGNSFFTEKTDSDIIKEILSSYSDITPDVEDTSFANPELVQNYTSNWDFIMQRAEINGLFIFNSDNELKIATPEMGASVLDILPGDGLIAFNGYMDARNQVGTIKSTSWDRESQDVFCEESSSPPNDIGGSIGTSELADVLGVESYNLQTTSSIPTEVLQKWVTSKHQKASFSKVQGTITIDGYSPLKLGDVISLDGLSDQFNGEHYVGGFEHIIEAGVFNTVIQLGVSPTFFSEEKLDIAPPAASGLISPIKGLHIGIVEQISDDDNGEYRVKVKLPTLNVDNLSVWARMSNFYSTVEAGLFFYPEVDDEVVVGFLNEDPQSPIILGSMYNKAASAPPYEPAEDNFIKAIVTKTGLTLEFNEENDAITLKTPGEQSIVIDDTEKIITITDSNDNIVELTDAGISLTTAGDLVFDAKGNIELNATGDVTVAATGDFTGEGMNVSLTGKTEFAAEGAMASVKGSGQTTIEGGIVMIN